MKKIRLLGAALAASLFLAACGGGDDSKPSSSYGKVVVFGDSLSDVGSYATQGVVLGATGGKFTVNGLGAKIWIERLADDLGLPEPCAARVGLESSGPLAKLAQATADISGCFDYAQGGARVKEAIGPGNKALIAAGDTGGYLGQLTEPLTSQVAHHLQVSKFAGDDLVVVAAGSNDLFMNATQVAAGAMTPADALAAMSTAATDLVTLIRGQIIPNGAKRVVVVNIPDISVTPAFVAKGASAQQLAAGLAQTFNGTIKAGLAAVVEVRLIDSYAMLHDWTVNPANYGLTNVTTPACDLAKAPTSLLCSGSTVIEGDISHYAFADSVHPTPYGYQLFANYALQQLDVAPSWR